MMSASDASILPQPSSSVCLSDESLIALARADDPWALATAASARVSIDQTDKFARVALALAATSLRVPELVIDALEGVDSRDADGLRTDARAAPSSLIEPSTTVTTVQQTLDAMQNASLAISQAFGPWAKRLTAGETCLHRASDRNVLVKAGSGLSAWSGLRDDRRNALHAELGFDPIGKATTVNDLPGMVVLAGRLSAWLLARVLEGLRGGVGGYTPRVMVVSESSPEQMLSALALRPLSVLLNAVPVRWYVGEGATKELEDELSSLWRYSLPSRAIAIEDDAAAERCAHVIERARSRQRERYTGLAERVAPRAERTSEYWAARLANAHRSSKPLRVLLPVTQYSTYLRHAAHDLRGAIERAGHEVMVLEEPACDLKPSAALELEAHESFDPDLTIVANWPRASRPNAWPLGSPAVCWVQDMLGSMLSRELSAQQTDLDFMIGAINGSLIRDWGYRADRARFLPTPACPIKFHPGPVDKERAARFACDVAYVSQQSETPDRFAQRLLMRANSEPERRVLRDIQERVLTLAQRDTRPALWNSLYSSVATAVDSAIHDAGVDPRHSNRILLTFAIPYAERARRHQTIHWAQHECAQRGLTLALYGDGWEHTPFSAHARGPVEHHEDLRACYATAGCHLHISMVSNAHQRVAECALSGGLMLRQGPSPDMFTILHGARERLVDLPPNASRPGLDGYILDEQPQRHPPDSEKHDVVRLNAASGRTMPGVFDHETGPRRAEWFNRDDHRKDARWIPKLSLTHFPDWSDDNAEWTQFATPEELGSRLGDITTNRDLRRARAEHHRSRALAYHTTDVFWSTILATVTDGITRS